MNIPTLSDDRIITPEEAARLLCTPVASLAKWRSTGEHNIPFLKVGRSVRYRTADLRGWIERHTQGGQS
jgi:excisionase family DNA binding protein